MSHHLLVAALAATTPIATPDEIPAELEGAEVIILEDERYERLTVPVTIKGQGPYQFMIDTGSQATVLSTTLADQLGLFNRSPVMLVGMASRMPAEITDVPEFGLGSRQFDLLDAPIVAKKNIGSADGILGLNSLQGQRVIFDFTANELSVADSQSTSDGGYEIVVRARERLGQLIITRARIDGVAIDVLVDTGAQGTIGNLALFERLRRSRHLGSNDMIDINGETITGQLHVAQKLEIGLVELKNLPVLFLDTPALDALGLNEKPALVLGMRELKLFRRVAIDFHKRRILFDLPAGTETRSIISLRRFAG